MDGSVNQKNEPVSFKGRERERKRESKKQREETNRILIKEQQARL